MLMLNAMMINHQVKVVSRAYGKVVPGGAQVSNLAQELRAPVVFPIHQEGCQYLVEDSPSEFPVFQSEQVLQVEAEYVVILGEVYTFATFTLP